MQCSRLLLDTIALLANADEYERYGNLGYTEYRRIFSTYSAQLYIMTPKPVAQFYIERIELLMLVLRLIAASIRNIDRS